MGADLYIEKVHHSLRKRYQPLFETAVRRRDSLPPESRKFKTAQREVTKYFDLIYSEGYFRDSYNVTNVLNRLGLSWWRDVQPLCTKNRILRGSKLRKFRDMVAEAKLTLPSKEDIEGQHGAVDEEGENSLPEWHTYFVGKQRALLSFLDRAIELNSSVSCSL